MTLGRWRYELLHQLHGLVHQPGRLGDVVFAAVPQPHTTVTRVETSDVGGDIRARYGHWAIA
jgi:hypothetical protein